MSTIAERVVTRFASGVVTPTLGPGSTDWEILNRDSKDCIQDLEKAINGLLDSTFNKRDYAPNDAQKASTERKARIQTLQRVLAELKAIDAALERQEYDESGNTRGGIVPKDRR